MSGRAHYTQKRKLPTTSTLFRAHFKGKKENARFLTINIILNSADKASEQFRRIDENSLLGWIGLDIIPIIVHFGIDFKVGNMIKVTITNSDEYDSWGSC